MDKWCLLLVLLGILSIEAFGYSYRTKRQTASNESNSGKEDKNERNNKPFPKQVQGQQSGQGQGRGQQRTTAQSPAVQACITGCPVTPEYNPVCGSNNITYNNPGHLRCAQACGSNVTLRRALPCSNSG